MFEEIGPTSLTACFICMDLKITSLTGPLISLSRCLFSLETIGIGAEFVEGFNLALARKSHWWNCTTQCNYAAVVTLSKIFSLDSFLTLLDKRSVHLDIVQKKEPRPIVRGTWLSGLQACVMFNLPQSLLHRYVAPTICPIVWA